ncbi:hypothetical protein KI387_034633 [Taxus chinensis]|uniref:HMA domain-containing protein n=1 Tax=Taxus chinensis TaxID=29808 RepID=A0AA38F6H4_TAXCH|nr:hypothetical protein KI387_034633 [Taxus chinensis]
MSKKMVLKVDLNCDKCKQRAMKTVASIQEILYCGCIFGFVAGVESVQSDMKEQKITVIGDADPVCIINKLRKFGRSELVSVGPAKEPEKKQAEKKEAPKEEKKEVPKEEKKEAPMTNITYNIPLMLDGKHHHLKAKNRAHTTKKVGKESAAAEEEDVQDLQLKIGVQKMVLKVDLNCDKCKQRAMKTVASIQGVESVQSDMKEQKITVIGDADPVCIINKLRKFGQSELVSVGPAKEPEKKQAEKKEAPKEEKKEVPKKEEKQEAPMTNITYVYLPPHCEPCCGGYRYNYCHY